MTRAIDAHAHLFPPSARDAARRGADWFGVRLELGDDGKPIIISGTERRVIQAVGHMADAGSRIAQMDASGVDVQILSLLPMVFGYALPSGVLADMASAVNDEIAAHIEEWPGRFLGFAFLPVTDTDAAVAELERAMALPGFVGAEVGTNVRGASWDDDRLFPILEAAERLEALVFIHPADVRARDLLFPKYYLRNAIGNPLETTTAAASLMFGGVLDRLPRLRLLLAHGGGYLSFGAGRLNRLRAVDASGPGRTTDMPEDYVRRFLVDALVHDERALRFLVDVMGSENVVLGTDFPADMGTEDGIAEVTANAMLSETEKALIIGGNLERELANHL